MEIFKSSNTVSKHGYHQFKQLEWHDHVVPKQINLGIEPLSF